MRYLKEDPIVISGIGLVTPLGNQILEVRNQILNSVSGVKFEEIPYLGKVPVGKCQFPNLQYQSKKSLMRGTRSGSISIFCANESLKDAHIDLNNIDTKRVGVIIGLAEHGGNETALETEKLFTENNHNINFWSPYHNTKVITNSPSGEVSINLKTTGPHYTIGGACSSGILAIIQGCQQILLSEMDIVICGGVSSVINSFASFASFKSQAALASHIEANKASRPLDKNRNGIVLSEGGALFVIERLSNARKRNASIYCIIESYFYNSDAFDFTIPNKITQENCIKQAIDRAEIDPSEIDLVNLHATGTPVGDQVEIESLVEIFKNNKKTFFNSSKANLGHSMGASGPIEIAANILSFKDNLIHPTINVEEFDSNTLYEKLITKSPYSHEVKRILKNSFGMMGTNACVILKKYE